MEINKICIICQSENSKYKCPKCHSFYCSVSCFKDHKNNCDKNLNNNDDKTNNVDKIETNVVTPLNLDELTIELLENLFNTKEEISLIKLIILLKRKISLKWFNGGALVMYCNCDIVPKFN